MIDSRKRHGVVFIQRINVRLIYEVTGIRGKQQAIIRVVISDACSRQKNVYPEDQVQSVKSNGQITSSTGKNATCVSPISVNASTD